MAVPIANDWKAIYDRMQQISAERSAPHLDCPRCKGAGWKVTAIGYRRNTYKVCDSCNNPGKRPRPTW